MNIQQTALNNIVEIIKNGEKTLQTFGAEFEHFLVEADTGRTFSYYEADGVRDTLNKLKSYDWETTDDADAILHLHRQGADITIEPAGQIELSIYPQTTIEAIDNYYRAFVADINRVIKPNQRLVSLGYHPKTRVNDLPFIPKERYQNMANYFSSKGKYAHNMMKGTASTQVAIDFENERDCMDKFRLFNVLSPFIFTYFDSAPVFESNPISSYATRMQIWENTDSERSGICKCAFNEDLCYTCYAETVLSIPPIILPQEDHFIFTGDKSGYDLVENYTFNQKTYEHIMTMLFPDVRLKHFLEIRMADAMPYPLNIGYVDFIQTLAYDKELRTKYLTWAKTIEFEDLLALKKDIIQHGKYAKFNHKTIADIMDELLEETIKISGSKYIIALKKAYGNKTAFVDTLKVLSDAELIKRSSVKL